MWLAENFRVQIIHSFWFEGAGATAVPWLSWGRAAHLGVLPPHCATADKMHFQLLGKQQVPSDQDLTKQTNLTCPEILFFLLWTFASLIAGTYFLISNSYILPFSLFANCKYILYYCIYCP